MPNKAEIARRFTRALPLYGQNAQAQHQIAQKLSDILAGYTPKHIGRALEIGSGSGIYSRTLQNRLHVSEWHLNDLCSEARHYATCDRFIAGDIETLPLNDRYNLITSASTFQWLDDPQALLRKLNACLKTGGILAFNTFTPENLFQIKTLTGIGLDYHPIDSWPIFLRQNGFQVRYTETATITLYFNDPHAVLRHLQHTGVTATQKHTWTPRRLRRFYAEYGKHYKTNQHYPLTYTPFFILATKL